MSASEPGPGRTAMAVAAWESVFRLQATMLRRLAADDVWRGLSVREYDVLYTLSRTATGRLRLGELSEEVYLPQPSLSRLVDRLERQGLLAREADAEDRRGVLVALTATGATLQREIGGRHAASIARHFTGMTAEDLSVLRRLCTQAAHC